MELWRFLMVSCDNPSMQLSASGAGTNRMTHGGHECFLNVCWKNAVIDSLQEQVNNAKDKLLKLMSGSHLQDEGEMDSSTTNLNSCSTQTTVVPLEPPPSPLKDSDTSPVDLSPPPYIPPPSLPSEPPLVPVYRAPPGSSLAADAACSVASPALATRSPDGASQNSQVDHLKLECTGLARNTDEAQQSLSASDGPGPSVTVSMPSNSPVSLNNLQGSTGMSHVWTSLPQGDAAESTMSSGVAGVSRQGFVSSEQLQEILQDLSMAAASNSHRSPNGVRRPSNPPHDDLNALITFSPLSPLSPRSPLHFYFPSISPYMMRKRRPPFHTSRTGPPPYYYPGSAPPGCRRGSAPPGQERLKELDSKTASSLVSSDITQRPDSNNDQSGEDKEGDGGNRARSQHESRSARRGSRRARQRSSSVRRPKSPSAGHVEGTRATDPYGYSDSESSSSEDYCYYHRPYCEACLHNPYASSSSSTSETSESEFEELYHSAHPVVNFKEDLKPTFV
ncbi:hypothetical protein NFI96_007605 [Prochilodus magdalenae]|nr:hypothetical protein NFI96_007605 [Prochilodus magdalenae]